MQPRTRRASLETPALIVTAAGRPGKHSAAPCLTVPDRACTGGGAQPACANRLVALAPQEVDRLDRGARGALQDDPARQPVLELALLEVLVGPLVEVLAVRQEQRRREPGADRHGRAAGRG